MVVVTHEMGFARRAANRVVFMADGQIVEEAAPGGVLHQPPTASGPRTSSPRSSRTDARPHARSGHRCEMQTTCRSYQAFAAAARRGSCAGARRWRPVAATTPTRTPQPRSSRRRRSTPAATMAKLDEAQLDHDRHQVRPAAVRPARAWTASRRASTSRSPRSSPSELGIAEDEHRVRRDRRRRTASRSSSSGKVDMVVATYTINDKRKERIVLRRPVLRRRPGPPGPTDDTDDHRPRRRSAAARRSARSPARPRPRSIKRVRRRRRPAGAVRHLLQVRRAAAQRPGRRGHHRQHDPARLHRRQNAGKFKVVGKPFTEEPYGIGVKKGDTDVPRLHQRRRSRRRPTTAPGQQGVGRHRRQGQDEAPSCRRPPPAA